MPEKKIMRLKNLMKDIQMLREKKLENTKTNNMSQLINGIIVSLNKFDDYLYNKEDSDDDSDLPEIKEETHDDLYLLKLNKNNNENNNNKNIKYKDY